MMKLGLMKSFFDTVDADWNSPIADQIASHWIDNNAQVNCLRASANFVFQIHGGDKHYFLRFNHESERTKRSIEAELNFVRHLIDQKIHAAAPVASLSGNFVKSISTPMGVFHAVLFEAAAGQQWDCANLTEEQFEMWGRVLGQIHAGAKGYDASNRPTWIDHCRFAVENIPESEEIAHRELRLVQEILEFRSLPIT